MSETETRVCNKCNIEKPVSEFAKRNSRKRAYQYACKECNRNHRNLHKDETKLYMKGYYQDNKERCSDRMKFWLYGITPEDYDALYKKQNGCCALCGRHQSELTKSLCIDHDHKTGKTRGLLCLSCNRGVGYLQDDAELCLAAYNYLRKH